MAGPVLVLHTTESAPGSAKGAASWMQKKKTMSHRVFDPSNGERIQLLDWATPARSLANLAGGVETNRRGAVYQLEIVGKATDIAGYSDAWFAALAAEVIAICTELGVPRRFPRRFVAYPASYGLANTNRMSGPEWLACTGIVGHQHVPESTHGDPGDANRLIVLVEGDTPVTATPDGGWKLSKPEKDVLFEMQQILIDAGFLHQSAPDGRPGPNTRTAMHTLKSDRAAAHDALNTATAALSAAEATLARLQGSVDPAKRDALRARLKALAAEAAALVAEVGP